MGAFIDLTSQKFNRLRVISRVKNNKHGAARWFCICNCGNKTIVVAGSLRSRHTESCGCLLPGSNIKHGCGGTRRTVEYRAWVAMHQRCKNSNSENYKYYGGRGISVCVRWGSFVNFLHDIGLKPTPKHSIDRRNSDGNYSPENCRWATAKEQVNNRRVTKKCHPV